jgi:hypothetical protein
MINKKGDSHVVDDGCPTVNFVDAVDRYQLYDGFIHPHPLRSRGCPAGGQSQSGGSDQPKAEKCIARPRRQTRSKRKGLATNHFTTPLQGGITAMKKRNIVISILALLVLIATFAASTAMRTQENKGEYVDDSVITNKVKALLGADDFFNSFDISVETYQGAVQLSGFVNSQKAVDKAGEIVRSVKGVKSIKMI